MLDNVKKMILEKQEYIEASKIIFEDTVENNLDDLIVLNEDGLKDTVLSAFSSNMSEETKKFNKYYGKYIRGIQKQVCDIFCDIVSSDSSLSELSENKAFFNEVRNAATKTIVVRGETVTIFDGQQSYKNGSGNHDNDVKLVAKAFSKTAKKLKSDNSDVSEIFKVMTSGWIGGHENDLPGIELSINTPSKVALNVGGENKSFKVSYEDKSYKNCAASILSIHLLSKKDNLKLDVDDANKTIVVKPDNVLEISGNEIHADKIIDPSIVTKIMKRVFGESFEEISDDESFMEASHNIGSKKPVNGIDTMKYIDNVDNDEFKKWFFKTPAGSKLDPTKFNMKKLVDNETTNEVVAYYVNDKVVGIIQSTISGSTQKINICAVHPKHKSCLKELVKRVSIGIADTNKVVELCKNTQKDFISAFKAVGFTVSKDNKECVTLKMDSKIKNKNESNDLSWVLSTQFNFNEADEPEEAPSTDDVSEDTEPKEDHDDSDDIMNTDISDDSENDNDNVEDDVEPESSEDDILDAPIDDGSSDDFDNLSLVGRQTGEPIELTDDDLLSVTIDLKSNTMTDVLPVPPDNAGEAISDDILSTRVDSGFEEAFFNEFRFREIRGDSPEMDGVERLRPKDELLHKPVNHQFDQVKLQVIKDLGINPPEDVYLYMMPGEFRKKVNEYKAKHNLTESSDSFLEGITLGGNSESSDDGEPAADDNPPADENEVTSAVKDKVAEAEPDDEPMDDESGDDLGGSSSAKEALMKKLSSITKSLEDAKNAVLKSM